MRHLPFTNGPRAVLDARALIADPERAARSPVSTRTTAWRIAASAMGVRIRQCQHRPQPEGRA